MNEKIWSVDMLFTTFSQITSHLNQLSMQGLHQVTLRNHATWTSA